MDQQPSEVNVERSEREILIDIARLSPKVTDYYQRGDDDDQKLTFLTRDGSNVTTRVYPALMAIDFAPKIDELTRIREEIAAHSGMNRHLLSHYMDLVDENTNKYRMLRLVQEYHTATTDAQRADIRAQYLEVNGELYGAPQQSVFESIIKDMYDKFEGMQLVGVAATVRSELFAIIAKPEEARRRFRPSPETVQWLGQVVDSLYGNLLQHVPAPTTEEIELGKGAVFTPTDIKAIIEEIIREEFGESADDWRVEFVPSGPIEVDRINKRINIPENRRPATRDELRGLIVHELGIHFLRGVMGYEMDNPLHAIGFRNYRLLEEGAGVANQQALKGEYADSGDSYYLVASLMELEGKNIKQTFEFMWRYFALKRIGEGDSLSEKDITAARQSADVCIDRMTKGMDDTPSNMDLSYYIGSGLAWGYYEKNRGDPEAISRFFMSRLNTDDTAQLRFALAANQLMESVTT